MPTHHNLEINEGNGLVSSTILLNVIIFRCTLFT